MCIPLDACFSVWHRTHAQGTEIMSDAEGYNTRPTEYEVSSPGLGHVFRAIVAYAQYIDAVGDSQRAA